MDEIRLYLYENIKDRVDTNIEKNSNLIANVDEIPLVLEPITTKHLKKLDQLQLKFILLVIVNIEFHVYYIW